MGRPPTRGLAVRSRVGPEMLSVTVSILKPLDVLFYCFKVEV